MSKLTTKEKSDLMELVTFLSTMSNTTVTLERGEFTISYPEFHTHIRLDFAPKHSLHSTYNILFAIDDFNKKNHVLKTYEELKKEELDPHKWFMSQHGSQYGVTLCSQKNVDEYNKQIKKFKKRYEKLEKDLRGDKDV